MQEAGSHYSASLTQGFSEIITSVIRDPPLCPLPHPPAASVMKTWLLHLLRPGCHVRAHPHLQDAKR